jgi:hypothetical protein
MEDSRSMATVATPAGGSYEPNPDLGAGSVWTTRLGLHGRWGTTATRFTRLSVGLEAGAYDRGYTRMTFDASGSWPLATGSLRIAARAGVTTGTPPVWRTFVLGGRGTLPGDPYRAWGGRHMALGRLEWRIPMRLPGRGWGSTSTWGRGRPSHRSWPWGGRERPWKASRGPPAKGSGPS